MGRVITQRRTEEEWDLLLATHRALYPLVDNQAFLDGDADDEQPMEVAGGAFGVVRPAVGVVRATFVEGIPKRIVPIVSHGTGSPQRSGRRRAIPSTSRILRP